MSKYYPLSNNTMLSDYDDASIVAEAKKRKVSVELVREEKFVMLRSLMSNYLKRDSQLAVLKEKATHIQRAKEHKHPYDNDLGIVEYLLTEVKEW